MCCIFRLIFRYLDEFLNYFEGGDSFFCFVFCRFEMRGLGFFWRHFFFFLSLFYHCGFFFLGGSLDFEIGEER